MKAWLLDEFTGIEKVRLADVPEPQLAPGEALVRIHFAALNPADRYLAEGQYPARPKLPHILGRDAAGEVITAAPGSDWPRTGDRVMLLRGEVGVSRPGSFAEAVAVPIDSLAPLPAGWGEEEAAGASLVYLTADQALTMWGPLAPSIVLVTGASGGVGIASIQLARALGHQVVALSRGMGNRQRLLEIGAQWAIDPGDSGWHRRLKDQIGQRVDLAIDNIGGELFPLVIDTLGEHGKVSCVGRLAGPVPQFNTATLFFRRLRIGGVAVGAYTRPEAKAAWQHILELLNQTGARPLVDQIFPFEQLPKAFQRLSSGHLGKVLLQAPVR